MNPPSNVSTPSPSVASGDARERFSAELEQLGMKPLWVIYRDVMTREPRAREVPYLWSWEAVRPLLLRAGELITAEEAERRVLMFLNPGNPPQIGATATLYAAAQLILPGETARAHRHTPAALRFIIEGDGAYTCVEGEKIFMAPGDLILTPAMVWHDHGNEGSDPVMWLDGLDIPLTTSLNCMFVEGFSVDGQSKDSQGESAPRQCSEKLYGRGLFPSESLAPPARPYSPVWAYRWTEAREALDMLADSTEPDRFDGTILRYVNPATGGEALPTMGCRLQLLHKGTHTAAHRHTQSIVYHVAEGSGYSILDGVRFNWRKGDTFAVPIWRWHEHVTEKEDAVLFSVTDEPVLAPLGLVRSEVYGENGDFQKVRSVFGASA